MYKKNVLFLIFPPRRKSAKPSRFIYSILELSIFCFSRILFFLFQVMLIIFPPFISFTPLIPSPLRGNLAVFISSDFGPTAVQLQVQSIKEFKVVIKHITKYQILTKIFYSTSNVIINSCEHGNTKQENSMLNPWFVCGFIDGEGSFSCSLVKNKKTTGWKVIVIFSIILHVRDIEL